jgi:cytochrome c oxidase cbb3-type subunit I/II
LLTQNLDTNALTARVRALRKIGVDYPPGYEDGQAQKDLATQRLGVMAGLRVGAVTDAKPESEIIAVIAYLQRLGKDIKAATAQAATN